MTPITEAAAAAILSSRRKRLGDGMLAPVRPLEFRDPWNGGTLQLHPGRDRVSADWWGYKERPELFRVVNRGDEVTAARHRQALQRARRSIERQLEDAGATGASPPGFRLPRSNLRETWRLP